MKFLNGVRIVHISLASDYTYNDPEQWLTRIDFFVPILEGMAAQAEVKSLYLINYSGIIVRSGVEYHFLNFSQGQRRHSQVLRYVADLGPDAVIVHGLIFPVQVMALRRLLKKHAKIVCVHHAERVRRFPKSLLQRIADRHVDSYLFASAELALPWIEAKQIKGTSRVHEVMEVTSIFELKPSQIQEKDRDRYLWVGRLDSNKDPLTLVNGFLRFLKTNPSCRLRVIYRGGELLTELNGLLSKNEPLSSQIQLIENIAHEEMKPFYESAGFIISTSHYEGSGTAVCEGLSCGCVPILSDIPSFRMMTGRGQSGLVFNPGDEVSLAHALTKSRTMNYAEESNKVLRLYTEKFSGQAIADRTIAIINSLTQDI